MQPDLKRRRLVLGGTAGMALSLLPFGLPASPSAATDPGSDRRTLLPTRTAPGRRQ